MAAQLYCSLETGSCWWSQTFLFISQSVNCPRAKERVAALQLKINTLILDIIQAFFGRFEKTQARKNSKLKQNPGKTQEKLWKNSKSGNSSWVELAQNWMKTLSFGRNLRLLLKTPFLLQNVFKNEKLLALFWNILKNLQKNSKPKQNLEKNSSQNSKKLKNWQL